MLKRILSLALIISFLSFGLCFAFDNDSIMSIWDDIVPTISECWHKTLTWIEVDLKPWIEANIGIETRQEFEKEFTEALSDVPTTIKAIWDKSKELLN
jgi:hypothetical protein